jgi:hypothetical protein
MFVVGIPSERELMCLARIKLMESLIPFVALFNEDEVVLPRRRACKVKYDYDWRVVVANTHR